MSESPYQSPDSNVTPKPAGGEEEQDLATFIGASNTEYYLERFRRLASGGGASWHWPAFFITSFWLLYRKMWLWALVYIILLPILAAVVTAVLGLLIDEFVAALITYGAYFVISFIVVPIFANRLYMGRAESKIAAIDAKGLDAETRRRKIASSGGTSILAAMIFIIVPMAGVLAAIAIPAYQDYTVRAQVSEGMMLAAEPKNAIVRYYETSGDFPPDNSAAGLPNAEDLRGNYVSSMTVDGSLIIVNYGYDAHYLLQGRALLIGLDAEALPAYSWLCGSEDIEDRHLPMACRE